MKDKAKKFVGPTKKMADALEAEGLHVTWPKVINDENDLAIEGSFTTGEGWEKLVMIDLRNEGDLSTKSNVDAAISNQLDEAYENFSIEWTVLSFGVADEPYERPVMNIPDEADVEVADAEDTEADESEFYEESETEVVSETVEETPAVEAPVASGDGITVYVNGEPVPMTGKSDYIFVDIFDRITFDLNAGRGRAIATILNGRDALFTEQLHDGDKVELYWKEK